MKAHIKWFAGVIVFAMAYLVAGKLGILLSIPPGYATAIFPASGVALAVLVIYGKRFVPGILIGSALMNISIAAAAFNSITYADVMISFIIGLGASLQGLVGYYLFRSAVDKDLALIDTQAVFRFVFLCGLLSCLISPSVGVTTLWLANIVAAENYAYSWYTWWVGDALGVLLIVPVIFSILLKDSVWRKRRLSVTLPMVVSTALLIPVYLLTSQLEKNRINTTFMNYASEHHDILEYNIKNTVSGIYSLRDYLNTEKHLNRDAFKSFTTGLLKRNHTLHALSFNQSVQDKDRAQFVAQMHQEGFADYNIQERDAKGQLMPAKVREQYTPVKYIEPMAKNKAALGFDVASSPARKVALDKARDAGTVVATNKINLVQGKDNQAGMLVFMPVFDKSAQDVLAKQENAQLRGYAVAVVKIGTLLNDSLDDLNTDDIVANLVDISESKEKPVLLASIKGQEIFEQMPVQDIKRNAFWWSKDFDVAGRTWQLNLIATDLYQVKNRSLFAWYVLAGGLFLISLLGAFLLIITGRSAEVEKLVQLRTNDLAETTKMLKESESYKEHIFNSVLSAIIVLNKDLKVRTTNAHAITLFGENLSSNASLADIMPGFIGSKDGADSIPLGEYVEIKIRTSARQDIFLLVNASEMSFSDDTLYIVTAVDISKQIMAESESSAKSAFISSVSHELRTPLHAIINYVVFSQNDINNKKYQRALDGLSVILASSRRLLHLINEILDYTKMENNNFSLEKATRSIIVVVNRALEEMNSLLLEKSITVEFVHDKQDAFEVEIDDNRMMQVIINVLSNAIKFSPRDSILFVDISRETKGLKLSITDSGPGINEDESRSIFQRFTQTDLGQEMGGTGLGLTIAQKIIEAHNGTITASNSKNHGLCVTITLPID